MAESTQCMAQRLTLHDEICEKVASLAPSPVALRILEVLRNERAPVQSLADVIATDPLLATRVLKLANLAAGQPQRLITVSHAISVMGLEAKSTVPVGSAEISAAVEPTAVPVPLALNALVSRM